MNDSIAYLLHTKTPGGSITVNGHLALELSPAKYFDKVSPTSDHSGITAQANKSGSTFCIRLIGARGPDMVSVLGGTGEYREAFDQTALAYMLYKVIDNNKGKPAPVEKPNLTNILLKVIGKVTERRVVSIVWDKGSYELTIGNDNHKFDNLEGLIAFMKSIRHV